VGTRRHSCRRYVWRWGDAGKHTGKVLPIIERDYRSVLCISAYCMVDRHDATPIADVLRISGTVMA
ncbi:hypothetical protein ACC763_39000, partial [Rhizobium ruizarguesonis]